MDIHEGPYLVRNEHTPLAVGMCFSNEPMLVLPGEFGVSFMGTTPLELSQSHTAPREWINAE